MVRRWSDHDNAPAATMTTTTNQITWHQLCVSTTQKLQKTHNSPWHEQWQRRQNRIKCKRSILLNRISDMNSSAISTRTTVQQQQPNNNSRSSSSGSQNHRTWQMCANSSQWRFCRGQSDEINIFAIHVLRTFSRSNIPRLYFDLNTFFIFPIFEMSQSECFVCHLDIFRYLWRDRKILYVRR